MLDTPAVAGWFWLAMPRRTKAPRFVAGDERGGGSRSQGILALAHRSVAPTDGRSGDVSECATISIEPGLILTGAIRTCCGAR